MATALGHRRAQSTRTLRCDGCGAPYMLAAEMLSLTCPYCGSAHVLEHVGSEELVPPDGFLPFSIAQPQKAAEGVSAVSEGEVKTWLGLYLPLWSFDLSGEIRWKGVLQDYNGQDRKTATGSFPVLEKDYLVPATRRIPEAWARSALGYSCRQLRPFRAEVLVDWPAETYQIPMSDAAVAAHAEVFAAVRERAAREIPPDITDLHFDSTRFTFDSFRLVLAPVWIGLSGGSSPRPIVVVNGQSGATAAERESGQGSVGTSPSASL
jgi:hypothetical protein